MKTAIIKIDIVNELDIVLAHKRASQICDLTGIGISGRTSFVTAISEICRNCLEHAGHGHITMSITNDFTRLEADISDEGKGIDDLDAILNKSNYPGVKGSGLRNSKKLVDLFNVNTSPSGTTVTLGMKIPPKAVPINNIIVKGWITYFENELPVSPYEEIKRQNMQLLELTEQLRLKNLESAEQLEQIKDLNRQLSVNNQELENFAYSISHDFKGPINNLKLLMALTERSNKEQKFERFKEFKILINRLDQMMNGLIEIIDLKNDQNILASRVAFEDILLVTLEELKLQVEETNAHIDYDFSENPTIMYHEIFLNSILLNLVSNAIKYRGSNAPLIRIKTSKKGDYTVLSIKDNGIGMDMAQVGENLFKPFRRFHSQAEGKGIGLHIVKSMVEKNGGKIEVWSEKGKGTQFTLYLKSYVKTEELSKSYL